MHKNEAARRTYEYVRTAHGRISAIYGSQRRSSKMRKMPEPSYTKEELTTWLYANGYESLYMLWKDGNYDSNLAPSVDRLDSLKPYTLDNIRLVTWDENNKAAYVERKTKRTTRQCRAVLQMDNCGNVIAEFFSIAQAARETNSCRTHINSVCIGKHTHANGFMWKYK